MNDTRWYVNLWNIHTRRFDTHMEFVSLEQAQKFVFTNVGYIFHEDVLPSVTLYTEILWDGSRAIKRMMNEDWEDYAIAFIDSYVR